MKTKIHSSIQYLVMNHTIVTDSKEFITYFYLVLLLPVELLPCPHLL